MKVYVSGSIYGGRQKIDIYKKLIEKLEEFAEVVNKNIVNENIFEEEKYQDDNEIFEDLERKMREADYIIAEVTVPALGVGYEIGFADMIGKKIIAIYDLNDIEKVTTMIRGNKRIKLIGYHKIEEIINNIEMILNNII